MEKYYTYTVQSPNDLQLILLWIQSLYNAIPGFDNPRIGSLKSRLSIATTKMLQWWRVHLKSIAPWVILHAKVSGSTVLPWKVQVSYRSSHIWWPTIQSQTVHKGVLELWLTSEGSVTFFFEFSLYFEEEHHHDQAFSLFLKELCGKT